MQASNPPTAAHPRSVSQAFAARKGRIGLVPFIPAGYPDLETTAALLPALADAGASVIEVGIPYSDPIADGPTIQASYNDALTRNKIKVADVLRVVSSVRDRVSVPIVSMVSYSVPFRYGIDRFVRDSKAAGFDGLLLPDLPPPEAQRVCDAIRAGGLDTVLLVAPTTPKERRAEIGRLSSGFVYYLSVSGITGERTELPADLADNVREIKSLTDHPVCVGFGISTRQHVQSLDGVADGAIVGSAIVKRMTQHLNDGPEQIAAVVGAYAREMIG